MKKQEEKLAMDFWGRVENLQKQTNISLKTICVKHKLQYQTMLNQKSTAHLPTLYVAWILSKELGTSIELLLLGQEKSEKIENCQMLAERLCQDIRLFSLAKYICNLPQEQLFALEVLLKIRN